MIVQPAYLRRLGELVYQLTLKAISTKDPVEAESLKEAAYLSDQLVDELMMSDLLVIACPMWNFGIPSFAEGVD